MNFFKWRISVKVKRLDAKEKVIFLANELVKAVQEDGKQFMLPRLSKGFGEFTVYIHCNGTDDPLLRIESILRHWRIDGKLDFKILEEEVND